MEPTGRPRFASDAMRTIKDRTQLDQAPKKYSRRRPWWLILAALVCLIAIYLFTMTRFVAEIPSEKGSTTSTDLGTQ